MWCVARVTCLVEIKETGERVTLGPAKVTIFGLLQSLIRTINVLNVA